VNHFILLIGFSQGIPRCPPIENLTLLTCLSNIDNPLLLAEEDFESAPADPETGEIDNKKLTSSLVAVLVCRKIVHKLFEAI
jgi:hypothetical protein